MNKFKKMTVKSSFAISVLKTERRLAGLYQVNSSKNVKIIDNETGIVNLNVYPIICGDCLMWSGLSNSLEA